MKQIILIVIFLILSPFCNAQNEDSIYSFMNNELPQLEFGKSSWGIFFLNRLFIIDSNICAKIKHVDWHENDKSLQDELCKSCTELKVDWQGNFKWEQAQLRDKIIVVDTKHRIAQSLANDSSFTKAEKSKTLYWINEWNKSKPDDRLINYSSIPIFSADQNYVLIVRGQHVISEGGWDTIYIYKKVENKWIVWKKISVSTI